jgi:cysteine-rich repeat protein
VCGDGFVQAGEACDDGNSINTDACTNACATAVCGDSVVGPGESCDDGNTIDTDGCKNDCTLACVSDTDCVDANVCNGTEICNTTTHLCEFGTPLAIDDNNACTMDSCDAVL